MILKDILQKTTQFFRDRGFETARLDTELLISSGLGWERMKLYLNYEYPLTEDELNKCRALVKRRTTGEPIAYILGKRDFYNHSFQVTPAVLIPRPETEQIVETAIPWLKLSETQRIVDLGTGSGCIGLSLLAELAEARLLAVDVSAEALLVAKLNAEQLGVSDRATFLHLDAGALTLAQVEEALGGAADAVVANPPYIANNDPAVEANVKKFEPQSALFSEDEGLQHIRDWTAVAKAVVRADGFAMFEIGYQQGAAALEIFAAQFAEVQIDKDLSGHDRFVRTKYEIAKEAPNMEFDPIH